MNTFFRLPTKRIVTSLTCSFYLFFLSTASATTILGMDIDKIIADAEFVFEGLVIESETRRHSSGIINTYVTFQIKDIIKGDYSGDSLELKFMGGELNGEVVEVSGMRMPELGEQGIYFVESMSRDLINPLIGWSQGHFIITDDNGTLRVNTAGKQPVLEVQTVSSIPSSIKKPLSIAEGSTDIAAGIMTDTSPLMVERALTVEEFKARITALLAN